MTDNSLLVKLEDKMASASVICIILFCIISTSICTNTTAAKSKTVKIRPNRPGKNKGKCVKITGVQTNIELKCRRKRDIIYSIDVNSYNSTKCNDDISKVCSGLQLPVLVKTNYCYFVRSCTIQSDNSTTVLKTSDDRCLGRKVSRVKLNYNCVDKGFVFYLKKSRRAQLNRTDERRKDNGMLIAHQHYPWNYPKGLNYEVVLKPINKTKIGLFISVPVMELNGFGDKVLITNCSDTNDGEDVAVTETSKGKAVYIRPSVEPRTSVKFQTDTSPHSAKGFIICYQWVDEDTDLSHVDVCSMLKKARRRKKKKKINVVSTTPPPRKMTRKKFIRW